MVCRCQRSLCVSLEFHEKSNAPTEGVSFCFPTKLPVGEAITSYRLQRGLTSNMAIVPAGNQGKVDAYADPNTAPTDMLLDVSRFFAP